MSGGPGGQQRARKGGQKSSPSAAVTLDPRVVAIQVLKGVHQGEGSLNTLLPPALERQPVADRARIQAWCYGLARWSGELSGLVDQLLGKPLKSRDLDVYLLLKLGIFQLRHTRMAAHAAVDETVKATRQLDKPWAKSLVNAVLRNYQRKENALTEALPDVARLSHPAWLLKRLQRDWPDDWQSICLENNRQGPMTLRLSRTASAETRAAVTALGGTLVADAPDAFVLDSPRAVQAIPGFESGEVSVQDAAAQLAVAYLERLVPAGGLLVDACAAPGGKTAHALESGHFSRVLALDNTAERLPRLQENLHRLGRSDAAEVRCVDAAELDAWWDGEPVDAVLLDAPCSGTGVIRRHPDIKLLRRSRDLGPLLATQARLLDTLFSIVKPGGLLLYATCSVLREENAAQIEAFQLRTDEVSLVEPPRIILPGEAGMDGFFYAALRREVATPMPATESGQPSEDVLT